jgi:hypothetical protein
MYVISTQLRPKGTVSQNNGIAVVKLCGDLQLAFVKRFGNLCNSPFRKGWQQCGFKKPLKSTAKLLKEICENYIPLF